VAQVTSALLGDVVVDANVGDDSQLESGGVGIDGDGGLDTDNDGDIDNAGFPTGYQDFYLMKYELSQGQYRDFLNTLTQAQQNTRTAAVLTNEDDANTYVMVAEDQATVSSRQAIKAGPNPADGEPYTFGCDFNDNDVLDESDDGEWIAMNYISWMDLAAYADWAGLRPMTELEFEKAARGPNSAVYSEYVWGTTGITQAEGPAVNSGLVNEVASTTGAGLANYGGAGTSVGGPLRVGFAATSSSSRISAGSGYYGNMNLGDNLMERTVTVGNTTGRAFQGTHGDGTLTTTASYEGNATNTDWPGIDGTVANGVTGATGGGFRGSGTGYSGSLNTSIRYDLYYASYTNTSRLGASGGRLARTADPKVTVIYLTTTTTTGNLGGRSGADTLCTTYRPTNLPAACVNRHAFISVSSTDEIQDMPLLYGYNPEMPMYWWHNTNVAYNLMAANWSDALDGSILQGQDSGTGLSIFPWTGSTTAGAVDSSYRCNGWVSTSGYNGRYGDYSSATGTYLYSSSDACTSTLRYMRCACQIDPDEVQ